MVAQIGLGRNADYSASHRLAVTDEARRLSGNPDRIRGTKAVNMSRKKNGPEVNGEVDLRPTQYDGYLAGSDGYIYSTKGVNHPTQIARRKSSEKSGLTRMRARLFVDGRALDANVAAVICEAFHGPRPTGCIACFIDGDRDNTNPNNLEWSIPKNTKVDRIAFVRAWQSSYSVGEVVDKMGISYTQVYVIARDMKNAGVPLKEFSEKFDIDELKRIAEEPVDD